MTGVFGGSGVLRGFGSPEGVYAAAVGTIFERLDGGAGSTLYVKEAGGLTAVGWVSYTGGGAAASIPAFVQAKAVNDPTANTTEVMTLDAPVSVHQLIVLSVSWGATVVEALTSVTDNLGNTYVRITAADQIDTVNHQTHTIYYCKDAIAGTPTITVTYLASRDSRRLLASVYSGCNNSAPLDQVASNFQANPGVSISAGSITPTVNNALVVCAAHDCTGGANTYTAGTGYTARAGNTGSPVTGIEDQVVVTPAATPGAWTELNDHRTLSAVVSFKPA